MELTMCWLPAGYHLNIPGINLYLRTIYVNKL